MTSGGPPPAGPAGRTANLIDMAAMQQRKAAEAEKERAKGAAAAAAAGASGAGSASAASAAALAAEVMGEAVAKATLARKVAPIFDAFLQDVSKDAAKKAATELGRVRGTPELAPELARLLVLRAAEAEKSGERRQFANLLCALTKSGKPPVASEADVCAGIAAAVAAITTPPAPASSADGEDAPEPEGPSVEANLRVRHLLEEVPKAKVGAIAADDLPDAVKAFLASPPPLGAGSSASSSSATGSGAGSEVKMEEIKASLSSIEGPGSWGDFGLGLPQQSAAAAPAPAAASAPAKDVTEAKAAAAAAEAEDKSVDAFAVASDLIASGARGTALLDAAKASPLAKVSPAKASAAIATAVFEVRRLTGLLESNHLLTLTPPSLNRDPMSHLTSLFLSITRLLYLTPALCSPWARPCRRRPPRRRFWVQSSLRPSWRGRLARPPPAAWSCCLRCRVR